MDGNNQKLCRFAEAMRLVALAQPPIAAMERVFSQLNLIQGVVGDKVLRDFLELRYFFRRNNGIKENYNVHGEIQIKILSQF